MAKYCYKHQIAYLVTSANMKDS